MNMDPQMTKQERLNAIEETDTIFLSDALTEDEKSLAFAWLCGYFAVGGVVFSSADVAEAFKLAAKSAINSR
jgi:hypothetical protein